MHLWKHERITFVLRFLLIFNVFILFFMNLNIYVTFIIKHEDEKAEHRVFNVTLMKQFPRRFFYKGVRQTFSKFTGENPCRSLISINHTSA